MKTNYRVSIDGYSVSYATREEAISSAETEAERDNDRSIKVYESGFNRLIWEN